MVLGLDLVASHAHDPSKAGWADYYYYYYYYYYYFYYYYYYYYY